MGQIAIADGVRTARVLVFSVDDGSFCIHLDWVEAVYPRDEIPLHTIKDASGASRSFLLHRGQPAMVVDLREAFDLSEFLGVTDRSAFLVVRAGALHLAVQVDACIGVRDLDLRTKVPVPSSVLRDGGVSVGHLVELDGKLHGLLEPNRILSGALHDRLEPSIEEALAFRDRQEKLTALAEELHRQPTAAALKTYGRLSRRNGRPRTANAVRLVLKALQDSEQALVADFPVAGDLEADTLLRDLIVFAAVHLTGELAVQLPGETSATVLFDGGRIVDASVGEEWGRVALKRILAAREGFYRFTAGELPEHHPCFEGATLWSLVETLDQLNEERRSRQAR